MAAAAVSAPLAQPTIARATASRTGVMVRAATDASRSADLFRTWGKTPGTQVQHWPFGHRCIEHSRGFRPPNAPSAWNLAQGFAPRTPIPG
jgi:hypothetical protein